MYVLGKTYYSNKMSFQNRAIYPLSSFSFKVVALNIFCCYLLYIDPKMVFLLLLFSYNTSKYYSYVLFFLPSMNAFFVFWF